MGGDPQTLGQTPQTSQQDQLQSGSGYMSALGGFSPVIDPSMLAMLQGQGGRGYGSQFTQQSGIGGNYDWASSMGGSGIFG